MTMRMLIDARHPEETRVAVVKGNRIEEFDFESAERRQLKGNIYLAKVTRVEPSLQAAFVDYGGNRHGFLAFSEIHPDYYQIPKEDREALLREEAEHAAAEAALRAAEGDDEPLDGHHDDDGRDHDRPDSDLEDDLDGDAPPAPEAAGGNGHDDHGAEDLRRKRMALRRRYKIQDVIHRRQVLLVQVVKEERGNKGAALTTYLSLAGRYCVLMPNTTHGGGISRKISNAADRKRLKTIMSELNLPPSMGCIVRTAGLQRTKTEIKRDFDYLARLWDEIRENTLKSQAPALINEDSDLIKRAIRDIYNREIDEVIVEGEAGYRKARDFMKLLMPSHVKKVKSYADPVSLYQRYGVEDQLEAMYHPVVQLKSGGYLVINPTEALVSIDINSGRSTREHGIEQTALSTNLEAAQEIARQLRLRDMAGLVVIDFIDMESNGNVRKVEKAMKAALANDRARIQVGRISQFGLLEMSRQRLRTGVLEASTRECPHCEGTGLVRTASSAGLSALRMLEEEAARGRGSQLVLRASQEAAFYVLNRKRAELGEIEARYGVMIDVQSDGQLEGARMTVDSSGPPPAFRPSYEPIVEEPFDDLVLDAEDEDEDEVEETGRDERGDDDNRRGRNRRRRRGRRGRNRDGDLQAEGDEAREDGESEASAEAGEERAERDGDREGRRRRRRGRRGGRRRHEDQAAMGGEGDAPVSTDTAASDSAEAAAEDGAPKPRRRPARAKAAEAVAAEAVPAEAAVDAVAEKPKRTRRKKADAAEADAAPEVTAEPASQVVAEKPKRSRAKKADAPVAEKAEKPAKAKPARAAKAPKAAAVEAAPVAEDAPAPAKKPRARKAKASTAADTATPVSTEQDGEATGEPRRGWWQRTFGDGA
ncbi:MAG: ribonuclease E/G [Alphaproteobacteria bacterium]|nr:ribonuclease E/G [Alphaproteobacteria bacterium]